MASPRSQRAQDLIWRLEAAGFDLLSLALRALPVDAVSASGGALFRMLGPLTRAHRTARRGLWLAFPEKSEAERRRILDQQWDNFGRYVVEFPLLDRIAFAEGRLEVVGAERLARIAAEGRSTVFISGHFSNLELMAAVIVGAGVDCEVSYRAVNNPYVDARIARRRFAYGVRMFAPKGGEGARAFLTAMAQGRSIALMNDQRYDGGVAGTFFGRTVFTNPAGVRLALRWGAPIVPLSIERKRGARFRCIVHEPLVFSRTGGRNADIAAGVAAINAFIEARVRQRPGEWWWVHRRWPREDYAEGVRRRSLLDPERTLGA